MLTQEDIDEAVKGQAEYWGRVIEPLEFWKTCKLSQKNLNAFGNLETLSGPPNVDWCMQPFHEGYEAFTRWRLSKFVEKHISWLFNVTYNSVKDFTGDASLAMTAAEHVKTGLTLELKARFP